MFFYHASPAANNLKEVSPTKRGGDGKKYACVATTVAQAKYWSYILGTERKVPIWNIYKVYVPDDKLVENCRNHYRFEKSGILQKASEVKPHDILDGEVCLFGRVRVVSLVETYEIKKWKKDGDWEHFINRQLYQKFYKEVV